jgi:periplasmic protein TonB
MMRRRPPTRPPAARTGLIDNPRVIRLRPFSTLQIALAVSLLAHAGLLTVRFVAPEAYRRAFQDTPLEVILVNARSNERPERAQAIAQANLAGGGEAERGRATSPLPAAAQARPGEAALDQEAQRLQDLQARQSRMLAQLRRELAQVPLDEPARSGPSQSQERERQRQAMVQLLAEIERRIHEQNARPRKRFIGPATQEAVYAAYYDALRRRIEAHGTAHFPVQGGRKLYGELTMVITVDALGRVLETEVVQSSGQSVLDRRAEAIVQGLNFGRFNDSMRRRADQIVVVSRFRFTREDGLHTRVEAAS